MNFPFDDFSFFNDNDIPIEWRNFDESEIPTREQLMDAGADPRFINLVLEGHSGDEDEEDEEEDEDEDEDDEEYVPDAPSSRVYRSDEVSVIPDDERNKRRRIEGGEASSSSIPVGSADCSQENEWNPADFDGLSCPICMDAWTNNGDHHICCLPCGHIYGMSCIKKWLQQKKNSGKCPQCNRRCSMKDVRKLYASRLVAVDEESQKRIQSLETKCASLESKDGGWRKKEERWMKREAALLFDVQNLKKRNTYLEQLVLDMQSRQSGSMGASGNSQWKYESEPNYCFPLQNTFDLHGARVFDIDTSNQILIIAQKSKAKGDMHCLTKISLISPFEMQDILLPSSTNGIRDLHISPFDSRQALYASFGKQLSVLSFDSGTPVLNYDLEVPAWSCSWDRNSTHYIYAGLQNGKVLVFDMRKTAEPLKSLAGLTSKPVHSLQSLAQTSLSSGVRTILSASAMGACQWEIDSDERSFMVPGTDDQGVCISLAYSPSSDDIVVSYRPKFNVLMDSPLSTPSPTPSHVIGQGVQGSHVLLKRTAGNNFQQMGSSYANVSKIRLPKSIIIDIGNQNRMFASGDEVTCDLVLQELPSFKVIQRFKMPAQARDIRYSLSHGMLGCLSENSLQIFRTNLL